MPLQGAASERRHVQKDVQRHSQAGPKAGNTCFKTSLPTTHFISTGQYSGAKTYKFSYKICLLWSKILATSLEPGISNVNNVLCITVKKSLVSSAIYHMNPY